MAEILSQWQSCDGWKVHIRTGGQTYFLNLPTQPDEAALAETITAFEQRQMEELAETKLNESEEVLT